MVPRPYLTLLLLLNYLLVVGAGLVERPPRAVERAFPYVHSQDCQRRNTLRLACFDDCNGVQYTAHQPGARPPLTQLLTTLKGLDLHCLPAGPVALAPWMFRRPLLRLATRDAAVPAGHRGAIDAPPRRG